MPPECENAVSLPNDKRTNVANNTAILILFVSNERGYPKARLDNSMHDRKRCLTIPLGSMSFPRPGSLALCRNEQAMAALRPHAFIVSEEITPPPRGHRQAVSRCGLLQHPRVEGSIPGENNGRTTQKLLHIFMDLGPRGRAGGFQCLPSESVQVSCAACNVALWEAE